ncbi:MAG: hypothetical protein ABJA37_10645 [Ferruginibacter sp.]
MVQKNKEITPLTWVIISAVGFILFLAAAILLMLYSNRIGFIKPQIYFFLLVIIGLVCAAFLSGAMKSHAKYTGQAYGGTLELGGPILVLVILIFTGYKFMPKKDSFTLKFTVFGTASKDELINAGQLKILLSKPDSQRIENGFVSFTDVDTKYRGKPIDIIANAPGYYSLGESIAIPDEDIPVELHLQRRPDSVQVNGIVIDKKGQPVPDAMIVFENGTKQASDGFGMFTLLLPFKDGKEINIKIYTTQRLRYNSSQVLSNTGSLTLQLDK